MIQTGMSKHKKRLIESVETKQKKKKALAQAQFHSSTTMPGERVATFRETNQHIWAFLGFCKLCCMLFKFRRNLHHPKLEQP
jgi:hypothetical protein